jgi:hypothetical protein
MHIGEAIQHVMLRAMVAALTEYNEMSANSSALVALLYLLVPAMLVGLLRRLGGKAREQAKKYATTSAQPGSYCVVRGKHHCPSGADQSADLRGARDR